jgi:uncharacterized membrane protein YccC
MLFSAKSFTSSMMAITIAQWAGLPRPFWAMMTAYIVASPLAGAVRSKAVFRFCGTFVGCTATLLMVPMLSNAPELLALALALWVAGCLYLSLLDRTPRAYVFMLAGYTAALIGFPTVETPLLLFDTASARVEEILLGITCATLVHSIVLPTGMAPPVLGLLDRALRDARQWFADLMRVPRAASPGHAATATTGTPLQTDRQRLATDITQLRMLSTHVPFDTTHLRLTTATLHAMQNRMASLTSVFSAVEDRLQALQDAQGALPADVTEVLARMDRWLENADSADTAATADLLDAIARLGERDNTVMAPPSSAWTQALRLALSARLTELVQGWQECTSLRRDVDLGLDGTLVSTRKLDRTEPLMHLDRGMAALSALAAFIAICVVCGFWMLTQWPMGSVAAMMASILCCFFATMDDPVPAIHVFLKFTAWSMPIAALYVLVWMPLVKDTFTLALVCAPLFLVVGCFMARPATGLQGMALLLGVAGTLSGHDTATGDFVSFLNSSVAQLLGIVVAARTTKLVRSVGSDWMARRIQRATWRELGELASGRVDRARAEGYAARTLDRIGLLAPRIAQSVGTPGDLPTRDALRDLRVGADLVALQSSRPHLPAEASAAVETLLTEAARFWSQRGTGRGAGTRPVALLACLDAALASVLPPMLANPTRRLVPQGSSHQAVSALVGLRRALFPEAAAPLTLSTQEQPT